LYDSDTLSNALHHHTELELIAFLLATNIANRVLAIASPPTILILAASSRFFYLHLCRTPTFSWSSILGDAMTNFW
jgi:hypothetical protein